LFSREEAASTELLQLLEGICLNHMVADLWIWMAVLIGGCTVKSIYAMIQGAAQDISVNSEFSSAIRRKCKPLCEVIS
jgi:hypothetical protein